LFAGSSLFSLLQTGSNINHGVKECAGSMMSAGAGVIPPADSLPGIIDPAGLPPSPVDSITAIGGGMPLYDPTMMAQTTLPAVDPTTRIGAALPYDSTMIDQWGLSTIDPSA
jgi:hypothetical protein